MKPEENLEALLSLRNIDDKFLTRVSRDGRWVAWPWFNSTKTK